MAETRRPFSLNLWCGSCGREATHHLRSEVLMPNFPGKPYLEVSYTCTRCLHIIFTKEAANA